MSNSNGSAAKPTVEELRAEIKQTRADLGQTVQALAAKTDVKARAMEQVEQTKVKVRAQAADAAERVRGAAVAVTDRVRAAARPGEQDDADPLAPPAQLPVELLVAGVVALVGVFLIVRGRRR